jgi:hypothetical protein
MAMRGPRGWSLGTRRYSHLRQVPGSSPVGLMSYFRSKTGAGLRQLRIAEPARLSAFPAQSETGRPVECRERPPDLEYLN